MKACRGAAHGIVDARRASIVAFYDGLPAALAALVARLQASQRRRTARPCTRRSSGWRRRFSSPPATGVVLIGWPLRDAGAAAGYAPVPALAEIRRGCEPFGGSAPLASTRRRPLVGF